MFDSNYRGGAKTYDAKDVFVRCGDWNSKDETEFLPHQDRIVEAMTIHPFAGIPTRLDNNVAVLMLKEKFNLNEHIDTICLPDPFNPPKHLGKECFVSGFGKKDFSRAAKYQNLMKRIQVDIVDHDECQTIYKDSGKYGPVFKLPKTLTCAGGKKGVDSCTGDGGGPLVCPDETRMTYYQVSIFSLFFYKMLSFSDDNVHIHQILKPCLAYFNM